MIYLNFVVGLALGMSLMHLLFWLVKGDKALSSAHLKLVLSKKKKHLQVSFCLALGVLVGLIFTFNWWVFGAVWQLVFWHTLSLLLLTIAIFDLSFRLIPIYLMVLLLVMALGVSFVIPEPFTFLEAVCGALIVGGLVLVLYLFTKGRGIGEADVFLAAEIGLIFGWLKGLLVFSVANFLGLVVILPCILIFGHKRMRQIPLVSFLVLAIFLEWYLGYTEWIIGFIGI